MKVERGTNALPNVKVAEISRWSDFKSICTQLKKPEAQEKYSTIVIDTVSIATDMCEKYILMQNDVELLSDIEWGGGWSQYKKEFENTFRELTYLGYGIVFIAHNKTKTTIFKDKEGKPISSYYPDITATGMNIVNRLVDVIAFANVEFDDKGVATRFLYTRQTPYIFAGSRYQYLQEKIPFTYKDLVNAIGDAIEEAIRVDGAEVTDHTELKSSEMRPFLEAQEEARNLWKNLKEKNEDNVLKIAQIVKDNLGREARISEITAAQQEILESIIIGMKELL